MSVVCVLRWSFWKPPRKPRDVRASRCDLGHNLRVFAGCRRCVHACVSCVSCDVALLPKRRALIMWFMHIAFIYGPHDRYTGPVSRVQRAVSRESPRTARWREVTVSMRARTDLISLPSSSLALLCALPRGGPWPAGGGFRQFVTVGGERVRWAPSAPQEP